MVAAHAREGTGRATRNACRSRPSASARVTGSGEPPFGDRLRGRRSSPSSPRPDIVHLGGDDLGDRAAGDLDVDVLGDLEHDLVVVHLDDVAVDAADVTISSPGATFESISCIARFCSAAGGSAGST